jgi:hypothetical protein
MLILRFSTRSNVGKLERNVALSLPANIARSVLFRKIPTGTAMRGRQGYWQAQLMSILPCWRTATRRQFPVQFAETQAIRQPPEGQPAG